MNYFVYGSMEWERDGRRVCTKMPFTGREVKKFDFLRFVPNQKRVIKKLAKLLKPLYLN